MERCSVSVDMWLPTTDFLPQPSLRHVLCGLDDAATATVDDFDAAATDATDTWPIVDGHHRACLAALRGERVTARVVEV